MAKKSIIKQLENMGATPTLKKSGILLAVSGDFNDGDYIDGFWTLDHEDIKLVIWLLQHYDYVNDPDVLNGKERLLLFQYVPQAEDTCMGIEAHDIDFAVAYVFENGQCYTLTYETVKNCKTPSAGWLYRKYYDGDFEEYLYWE